MYFRTLSPPIHTNAHKTHPLLFGWIPRGVLSFTLYLFVYIAGEQSLVGRIIIIICRIAGVYIEYYFIQTFCVNHRTRTAHFNIFFLNILACIIISILFFYFQINDLLYFSRSLRVLTARVAYIFASDSANCNKAYT